jgi:hypothetical protein
MSSEQQDTLFGADAFTRMWTDFATKMTEAGLSFPSQVTPPDAFRQLRGTMLRAWAEYCDQFMRTDEFLTMMKQSLDGAIQARRQLNEFLGEAQHALQGASRQDLDKLLSSLERLEGRLTDERDAIDSRLDELSERLARLEQAATGPNGHSKRKRGPTERHASQETTDLETQP